jgi:hypothetical protein
MKYRVYAILQLFIMVFYLGRPILPYIEYAVFKDYIAKNLCINRDKPKSCCQGKCHLKKQIEKNSETSDTEEKSSNRKILSQEVQEFLISPVSIPKAKEISFLCLTSNEIIITTQVVSSIFVPPKTLAFS